MPDGSNIQQPETTQETPDPKHFIRFNVEPSDSHTEAAAEAFRADNGIRANHGSRRAVWAFLAACKALSRRSIKTFAWPTSKQPGSYNYQAKKTVRDTLISEGFFRQVGQKGNAISGRCTVYELDRLPDIEGLRFQEIPPERHELVKVRDLKPSHETKNLFYEPTGKMLTLDECYRDLGMDRFDRQLDIMEDLNGFLFDHPLVLNGDTYNHLVRKFNNRSLCHGGRLYGGYSAQKKEYRKTATIDGEPIVQLDVKASFLFIRGALGGVDLGEAIGSDPYELLPFFDADDRMARSFFKELVSAMITCGGTKTMIPDDMMGKPQYEHITQGKKKNVFQSGILESFPFLADSVEGLHVMYLESEAMVKTLFLAIDNDIPAWPLHDCIFVRRSDLTERIELIKTGFQEEFGFRPTISVDLLDGTPESMT